MLGVPFEKTHSLSLYPFCSQAECYGEEAEIDTHLYLDGNIAELTMVLRLLYMDSRINPREK